MKLKFIYSGVVATFILSSCGSDSNTDPSACDCVNFFYNTPALPQDTIRSPESIREDNERDLELAKNCAIKFGELSEEEKKIAKNAQDIFEIPYLGETMENVRKKCNK